MPRNYIHIDNMGEVSPRESNMTRIDQLVEEIDRLIEEEAEEGS